MKKAVLVIGKNYTYNLEDIQDSFVIGVDAGAKFCLEHQIPMDLALGDFDSISSTDLDLICKSTHTIQLNPIKDETDTLEAIKECKDYDEILILGSIQGKRIEHFYANLLVMFSDERIRLKDDDSLIFTTSKSIEIQKENYTFCSIFSLEDRTRITLKGFKYPLSNFSLVRLNPLGVSNELVESKGSIELHEGKVMVILSKEDRRRV